MIIKKREGFQGERVVIVPEYIRDRLEKDPFFFIFYITDIGYYPCAEHHYVTRNEALKQNVLLYCINGKGKYSIGQTSTYTEIRENQYVILPANEVHEYCSCEDTPWTIYWIHFAGTLAYYYAKDAGKPQNVMPNIESRISNRISIFEEILTVMQTGLGDDNLHYVSSLLHHFLASLRYLHSYREANNINNSPNIIDAAIHYMDENMERHLSLQQIADYVGLSISNFSLKFRMEKGCSPIAYMNRMKIEKACDLLQHTDMKINQISYKLGVNDALYFSRMFSKYIGMSPSEYKLRK